MFAARRIAAVSPLGSVPTLRALRRALESTYPTQSAVDLHNSERGALGESPTTPTLPLRPEFPPLYAFMTLVAATFILLVEVLGGLPNGADGRVDEGSRSRRVARSQDVSVLT